MTNNAPPPMPSHETRVLVLPPTSRDAKAIEKLLSETNIACVICVNMNSLREALHVGAGAVVVSEESVTAEPDSLAACVRVQAVWSDIPIIILSRSGAESPKLAPLIEILGNVTVLERPLRVSTLLSSVGSALRARSRQYQVRSYLAERRRSESGLRASAERLRLAVQTGKLGTWELDLRTQMMSSSPIFKENFGRSPYAAFSYDDFWNAIHPEDASRVRAMIDRTILQRTEYDTEYRAVWPDGTIHWLLARGQAEFSEHATAALRLMGVTLDISERKAAEEHRTALLQAERAARAEAERAGQMKDEFLATLSHELRTPLNAIVGWAQILKSNPSDAADVLEGITVIERNARTQTQIIEDLMDMSRIISGKIRLNVQRVDLASVIGAAVDTVRQAANAKGVRLDVVLERQGGTISGDSSRLQQVFWNLLSNSVKFCRSGGRIRILLEQVESNLKVAVTDDGEGIKPEFLPYIFDRFRQADGSITRKHGGLGLGLSIVKQLVELHGGRIEAASPGEGRGATFTVTLPMTPLRSRQESPRSGSRTGISSALTDSPCAKLTGVQILVVDDEADSRALAKRLLEDCEAIVTTASSAAEALQLYMKQKPQVLVSDIGMPGEDGYTLLRKIREREALTGGHVPAIALTAYARAEERTRAIQAGFQTHVTKPVSPNELIASVATLAGQTQAIEPIARPPTSSS